MNKYLIKGASNPNYEFTKGSKLLIQYLINEIWFEKFKLMID